MVVCEEVATECVFMRVNDHIISERAHLARVVCETAGTISKRTLQALVGRIIPEGRLVVHVRTGLVCVASHVSQIQILTLVAACAVEC